MKEFIVEVCPFYYIKYFKIFFAPGLKVQHYVNYISLEFFGYFTLSKFNSTNAKILLVDKTDVSSEPVQLCTV